MNRMKRRHCLLFFLSFVCLGTLGSYGCGSSGDGNNSPNPSQSQTIYQPCEANQDCDSDETCVEVKIGGKLSGYCSEICEGNASCPTSAQGEDINASCIALEAGATTNYCSATCEEDADCPDNLVCQTDANGTKLCLAEIEKSGPYEGCTKDSECQEGMACIMPGHTNQLNLSPGYCSDACNEAANCPQAPAGGEALLGCFDFGGGNFYCALDCTADADACPGGYSCELDFPGAVTSTCFENL